MGGETKSLNNPSTTPKRRRQLILGGSSIESGPSPP